MTLSSAKGGRGSKKKVGSVKPMSLKFGSDPILWACWLYYEEGLTQSEIAEKMGVSRPSVNSYLADARQKGIVEVSIEQDKLRSLSVAAALTDFYGLQDCLIIPTEGSDQSLIDRLGHAGAHCLQHYLRSGDSIGIGWGRTVLAVAKSMKKQNLSDIQVIQTIGSTLLQNSYSPESCASKFATAAGAECMTLSAPAVVLDENTRKVLLSEPVISEQLKHFKSLDRILFGISSLRENSTVHSSGFFENSQFQREHYHRAVAAVAGSMIDENGHPVDGPLDNRTIGISLAEILNVEQRIAVAGGFDKMPAILATLRGKYANVLVTDVATGWGIIAAEGREDMLRRPSKREAPTPVLQRSFVKKLINRPADALNQALEGAVVEHSRYLGPIKNSNRALLAKNGPRPNKVGLVIGGGSGHEPCFLGYVGRGMADAVAIGNIFASPPPGPILECTIAANNGSGVLYIFGNYSGDVLNFKMAADQAAKQNIDVRTIVTTDDIASSPLEDKEGRRGVAGNIFVFKIAGAACDLMWSLDQCEEIARKANQCTYSVGIALEPCSLPETRRPSYVLGEDEMEVGVGVHGEPGILRQKLGTADDAADIMIEKILQEMSPKNGDEVALLVNSLGGTPLMELYIISRRVRQRLSKRGVSVYASWTGNYLTSLDMVGVSVSILHLDEELKRLLDHDCDVSHFRTSS